MKRQRVVIISENIIIFIIYNRNKAYRNTKFRFKVKDRAKYLINTDQDLPPCK